MLGILRQRRHLYKGLNGTKMANRSSIDRTGLPACNRMLVCFNSTGGGINVLSGA